MSLNTDIPGHALIADLAAKAGIEWNTADFAAAMDAQVRIFYFGLGCNSFAKYSTALNLVR